jgi:hypothetical protein
VDNFVQDPGFTQSYNRYSYVWNNPLKHTDPDGEFIVIDSWLVGFVDGFFSSGSNRFGNAWNEANHRAGNDAKIWGGLFATDPNKSFGGKVWEIASRFTWQLPQTLGGLASAHTANTVLGNVNWVKYKYGATVVQTEGSWGGVTQGSYILGDESIEADANNSLFQHEYGHYIQSQSMGWAYYPRVGIPSMRSKGVHDFHSVEQDANRRAFLYFNKNIDGFYVSQDDFDNGVVRGWNFFQNPLNVDGSNTRDQYVDYRGVL